MTELTVVAFNAHWGIGAQRRRLLAPFDVSAALAPADADVYVVPEHFRFHDGRGITDDLVARGWSIHELPFIPLSVSGPRAHVAVTGDGWWSLAILTKRPVLETTRLPIGWTRADPVRVRSALHVAIDVDGTRVDVVGLHTSSKLWWGNPVTHMRRLRPHVESLLDRPAILAGDFNMWGPVVERVLPGWRRAVRAKTFMAPHPHHQIDHVLVSRAVEPLGGGTLGPTGSDHLPIRSVLRVPTYPPAR